MRLLFIYLLFFSFLILIRHFGNTDSLGCGISKTSFFFFFSHFFFNITGKVQFSFELFSYLVSSLIL